MREVKVVEEGLVLERRGVDVDVDVDVDDDSFAIMLLVHSHIQ